MFQPGFEVSTLSLLKPDEMVDSVYEIDLKRLKELGICGIITDLDNTLVAWRSCEVTDILAQWVQNVRAAGLKIAVVSNNSSARVQELANKLGVAYVAKAIKPRRKAFRKIADEFKLTPEKVAVVGDQLFTDILGGNRSGMYTILVTPISKQEFIGTKIVRCFERFFVNRTKKA